MLSEIIKNKVLIDTAGYVNHYRQEIISANQIDLDDYGGDDPALRDRLYLNADKVEDMITSLYQVASQEDPVGKTLYSYEHANGMTITNKTCSFGTVLIIYESRPDVTIEAASIAFKSGNKILLKGGKEARKTNEQLMLCWHKALIDNNLNTDFIQYLNLSRENTQKLLMESAGKFDLIVPRGGEALIRFVKEHASCPVIVSGRGNNFVFVHASADQDMALEIIMNAKTTKISACNALDKVLIDKNLPDKSAFIRQLLNLLHDAGILIKSTDPTIFPKTKLADDEDWDIEYLDNIIMLAEVENLLEAVSLINKHSGKHSASVITNDQDVAFYFQENTDVAAVYHNASTRFTDGGQFGLGAELAISTDKIHHRGPMGISHLVSNKWYITGNGQTR